jgi:hypothetical protein
MWRRARSNQQLHIWCTFLPASRWSCLVGLVLPERSRRDTNLLTIQLTSYSPLDNYSSKLLRSLLEIRQPRALWLISPADKQQCSPMSFVEFFRSCVLLWCTLGRRIAESEDYWSWEPWACQQKLTSETDENSLVETRLCTTIGLVAL